MTSQHRYDIAGEIYTPWSLRFRNKELEHEFDLYYPNKYLFQLRLAHILATCFYLLAIYADSIIYNTLYQIFLFRIIVIPCMFFIGLLITFYHKRFYLRYYQWFNVLYVLVTSVSFILSGYDSDGITKYFLYSGVVICLIFNYTFIKQDFLKASIVGLLVTFSFLIPTLINPIDENYLVHIAFYIFIANFLGMFIAYMIEFDGRKSFVLTRKIEQDKDKISMTNESLESLINQRTKEIQNINTDLHIAKEKAEESDRLKSAFLANMSHEIRTPMNSILGFSNLLKEENFPVEQQKKFLGIIQKSGNRMLSTINDLIDISKIEAGQMALTISDVHINQEIQFLSELFQPEAQKSGLKLSFQTSLPDNKAIVQSDQEKIHAILINLIKNSIKYTNEGDIKFGYTTQESLLQFYVKDTGIGISETKQQVIFDRFVQADITLSSKYEGSGLGLAISKAYVEMLGGNIWLESEMGKEGKPGWTHFYFTIPFNPPSDKPATETTSHSVTTTVNSRLNLKILNVDDEPSSSEYLSCIMKLESKEILHAENGYEAVDVCRNNPDIDLVLMDIKLPDLNGYDAVRMIRDFNQDILIIAQTAYALAGDREKAMAAGCNGYISKPVNKELLLELVKNLVYPSHTPHTRL